MRIVPLGINKTQKENYCMISLCVVSQMVKFIAPGTAMQEGFRTEDSENSQILTDIKSEKIKRLWTFALQHGTYSQLPGIIHLRICQKTDPS